MKKKTPVSSYWPRYRRRVHAVITSAQTVLILLLFLLLEQTGLTNVGFAMAVVIAAIVSAVLGIVTITLIHILDRPFGDLVQAVALAAGQSTIDIPPNPNDKRYEKDGFGDILQTVYELGTHGAVSSSTPMPVTTDDALVAGVNNTSTGIVIMDEKRQIVFHNKAAPVRIGIDGKPVLDLLFPDDDPFMSWLGSAETAKAAAEHQWTRVSDKLPGEEGRRMFDVAANYDNGSHARTVLTLFDRSTAYMPEEDELDFISFAAHELRGPITVIRGYLDVLLDELRPQLRGDQSELMERLVVTSNRLTSYVNNILNTSQYDRRHLKLHLVEEKLSDIYDTITDDMQLRASTQNRVLVVDIPDNLPTVAADTAAISEVLGNLIDNAIKYSNEGGLVHVVARPIPGFVEVSVIDRGIGMPLSVLPNLFHKFYRSHRSRETVAGTGIGLYISRAIVSSHGGTITASSTENEGSTFSFTLPIYDTVAEKLKNSDNSNIPLIEHGSGWIKNHSMYRG